MAGWVSPSAPAKAGTVSGPERLSWSSTRRLASLTEGEALSCIDALYLESGYFESRN